jgi:hypothetical protein
MEKAGKKEHNIYTNNTSQETIDEKIIKAKYGIIHLFMERIVLMKMLKNLGVLFLERMCQYLV